MGKDFKATCKYTKFKKIGSGSFGNVYRARSPSKNEIVAIKKLKSVHQNDLMEIIALRHLHHPNIISILDILNNDSCLDKKKLAFVMPFAMVIDDYFNTDFVWDELTLKSIIYQLIDGLKFMHDNHLLHLDIKPDNLLIMGSWENPLIKYTDLGLAMFVSDPDEYTYSPFLRGTSTYRPVEVAPAKKKNSLYKYSGKADVYAVGISILAIKYKSHAPFEIIEEFEDANDYEFIKYKYTKEWKKEFQDKELVEVIEKMISVNPKNRYTVNQLIDLTYFKSFIPSKNATVLEPPLGIKTSDINFNKIYDSYYDRKIPIITYIRMMDLFYLLAPYMSIYNKNVIVKSSEGKIKLPLDKVLNNINRLASILSNNIYYDYYSNASALDLIILKTFKGIVFRETITDISDNLDDALFVIKHSTNLQEYNNYRLKKSSSSSSTKGEKINQKTLY